MKSLVRTSARFPRLLFAAAFFLFSSLLFLPQVALAAPFDDVTQYEKEASIAAACAAKAADGVDIAAQQAVATGHVTEILQQLESAQTCSGEAQLAYAKAKEAATQYNSGTSFGDRRADTLADQARISALQAAVSASHASSVYNKVVFRIQNPLSTAELAKCTNEAGQAAGVADAEAVANGEKGAIEGKSFPTTCQFTNFETGYKAGYARTTNGAGGGGGGPGGSSGSGGGGPTTSEVTGATYGFGLASTPSLISGKFVDWNTLFPAIINFIQVVAVVIFVFLMLIGGFQYLNSGGDEESTKKARKLLIDAVAGIFIILAAQGAAVWLLTQFGATSYLQYIPSFPFGVASSTTTSSTQKPTTTADPNCKKDLGVTGDTTCQEYTAVTFSTGYPNVELTITPVDAKQAAIWVGTTDAAGKVTVQLLAKPGDTLKINDELFVVPSSGGIVPVTVPLSPI